MTMPSRTERAEALHHLLLSLAVEKAIGDEVLAEALALIKKPTGQLSVAEYKRDQLLNELMAGNIEAGLFMQAWAQITVVAQATQAPAVAAVPSILGASSPLRFKPSKPLIALALATLAVGLTYWRWEDYQAWLDRLGIIATDTNNNGNWQISVVPDYVTESIKLASTAKVAVTEYYMSQGTYPANNQDIGLPPSGQMGGGGVASIAVDKTGAITITFKDPAQTLVMTPTPHPTGMLMWDCKGGTLPAAQRPQNCR